LDLVADGSASPDAEATGESRPDGADPEKSRIYWPFHGLAEGMPRAISYSGYRDGQNPGWYSYPSPGEILEDLRLLNRHWQVIRLYDTSEHARRVLQVIDEHEELTLKVMLGAWLASVPRHRAANRQQVVTAVDLANQYEDIVVALSIGNEALVEWSAHRIDDVEEVIDHVRQARDQVSVPVTVADNYLFWTTAAGARLAEEVDFVTVHTYAQWLGYSIDQAVFRTEADINEVRKNVGDKVIIIGEAGWTTATNSAQMKGAYAHEYYQKRYYDELMEWAAGQEMVAFFFEAFDENWKGGPDDAEPEKHWGLFTIDREAKYAMYELFPELAPAASERVTGPPRR
jgi:exo-beta-1,3-glucanase (GH17 family)